MKPDFAVDYIQRTVAIPLADALSDSTEAISGNAATSRRCVRWRPPLSSWQEHKR